MIVREDGLDRIAAHHASLIGNPQSPKRRTTSYCVVAQRLAGLAPGIGEELQRTRLASPPGSSGRRLPAAELRGLAKTLAGLRHALAERQEIVAAHIDLAAHLDARRAHLPDSRCGISSIVRMLAVTFSPVVPSPRVAAVTSLPLLVAQRHRQAVDLRLGGEDQFRSAGNARKRRTLADEIGDVLVGEDVVERQHRPRMNDLPERAGRCCTDFRDGESSRTSSGKRASISALRRRSASYSASEIVGASSA